MKPKNIPLLLPLLLMTAIIIIMPGVGEAAMWIGGQAGVNFVASGDVKGVLISPIITGDGVYHLNDVTSEPAFIGGITIGYDFVKEGFLGHNWPNWLKYFSLALDITYNGYSQLAQDVKLDAPPAPAGLHPFPLPGSETPIRISHADGSMLTLSLLSIVKYGFFSSPEFPYGRLIPYAGVGPEVCHTVITTPIYYFNYPTIDCWDYGIVNEAGVRYMLRPNISLDAAFRYSYLHPSYDRAYDSNLGTFYMVGGIFSQEFSAIFRVAYHF